VLTLDPDAFDIYGRRGYQSKVVWFMLAHGRMFERGTLPGRRGGWFRAPKQCYRNAYCNADTDRDRYSYCEGFCWSGDDAQTCRSFVPYPLQTMQLRVKSQNLRLYPHCRQPCLWPFKHAWFIDREKPDIALDATLNQNESYGYLGIPITWECIADAILAEGFHGSVLDYWEKIGKV